MALEKYVPLVATTLTSSAAVISFSSIPQGYKDLLLVVNPVISNAGTGIFLTLNSDSGNNYSVVNFRGTGSTTGSWSYSSQPAAYITYDGIDNVGTLSVSHLMDYSATNKYKSILTRHNAATYATSLSINTWANNSAVTSLTLTGNGVDMVSGTTISLYGVR